MVRWFKIFMLIAAEKTTRLEGEPPTSRIVVIVFDSLEKSRRSSIRMRSRRPGRLATKPRYRSHAIEGILRQSERLANLRWRPLGGAAPFVSAFATISVASPVVAKVLLIAVTFLA